MREYGSAESPCRRPRSPSPSEICPLRLLLLLVGPVAFAVLAQHVPPARAVAPPKRTGTIGVDLQRASMPEALRTAFRGTGLRFAVARDVPAVAITLSTSEVTPPQAADIILGCARDQAPNLIGRWDGKLYRVEKLPRPRGVAVPVTAQGPRDPRLDGIVALSYRPARLWPSLPGYLEHLYGVQIWIDPASPNLAFDYDCSQVRAFGALLGLVDTAQEQEPRLRLSRVGDVYTLTLGPARPATPALRRALSMHRVTVSLRGVPAEEAVRRLFAGSRQSTRSTPRRAPSASPSRRMTCRSPRR